MSPHIHRRWNSDHQTVLLVHALNLGPVSPSFPAVEVGLIPPCQSRQFGAGEFCQRPEEQSISAQADEPHGGRCGSGSRCAPGRHAVEEGHGHHLASSIAEVGPWRDEGGRKPTGQRKKTDKRRERGKRTQPASGDIDFQTFPRLSPRERPSARAAVGPARRSSHQGPFKGRLPDLLLVDAGMERREKGGKRRRGLVIFGPSSLLWNELPRFEGGVVRLHSVASLRFVRTWCCRNARTPWPQADLGRKVKFVFVLTSWRRRNVQGGDVISVPSYRWKVEGGK